MAKIEAFEECTAYLEDVMDFGKHEGKSLKWIMKNDNQYIVWLHDQDFDYVDKDEPEEGDDCRYHDCDGKYEFAPEGDCYCHKAPPCSSCVEAPLICPVCGDNWAEDE